MKVFLALPSGDYSLHVGAVFPIVKASQKFDLQIDYSVSSFLQNNFNILWCSAIKANPDYFIMLHNDIHPDNDFIEKLIEECRDFDIVSAVAMIKDDSGETSTAMFDPKRNPQGIRLNRDQIRSLPMTFTEKDVHALGITGSLLFNTGCWIVKWGEWCNTFPGFEMKTPIAHGKNSSIPLSFPEDWLFSSWARQKGLKYAVTSKVEVKHYGTKAWTL